MRKITSTLIFGFGCLFVYGQNLCLGYFPIEEGLKFELTSYDKEGQATTIARHEVVFFEAYEGKVSGEYTSIVSLPDGEELSQNNYEVECKDGALHLPYTVMLAPGLLEKYVTMDLTVSGEGVSLPMKLEKGMELEDGFTEVEVASGEVKLITMRFEPFNRKVIGQETITTPAGTFECFKVTYDLDMKIIIPKLVKVIDWYAEGIGLVKQELKNKKGKPMGSMMLTNLERE